MVEGGGARFFSVLFLVKLSFLGGVGPAPHGINFDMDASVRMVGWEVDGLNGPK